MKKIIFLAIILILSTACSNYTELNNLEIIDKIAIEYKDDTYRIIVSSIEKDDDIIRKSYEVEADNLRSGIEKLNLITDKKIYITHLDLLILTSDTYNAKITEIIDYFLNDKNSRNDFLVTLTNDIDVIKEDIDLIEKLKIIENNFGSTKTITLEEMLKDILEKKITYVPTINYQDDIEIEGISIIKDKKVIEHLTKDETIFYNFLKNNIKNTSIKDIEITSNNTGLSHRGNKITLDINSTLYQKSDDYEKIISDGIKKLFESNRDRNIDIFNFTSITNKNLKDISIEIKINGTSDIDKMEVDYD